MKLPRPPLFSLVLIFLLAVPAFPAEPITLDLWPGDPPGQMPDLPPEQDTSEPGKRLIAGKPLIRLGNVTRPQITIYRPDPAIDTGTAMIIAPGGGHWILAYDLEGTEVAEWLNTLGVTGIVLKYRVPGREWDPDRRWLAAVQDAQRAVSLVRSRAKEFGIDPAKVGIMGFSAGAQTALYTATQGERIYEPVDAVDEHSYFPDCIGLIYGGGSMSDGRLDLSEMPPVFIAIAHDDQDRSLTSAQLYIDLKRKGASAELHVFESGGHGYGLRPTYHPVTVYWPRLMAAWLGQVRMLK